jgi:hypothetical protein
MDEKLKDRDILPVREKGSNELNVAKMGGDGNRLFKRYVDVTPNEYRGCELKNPFILS